MATGFRLSCVFIDVSVQLTTVNELLGHACTDYPWLAGHTADSFNMGSLRSDLHLPGQFPSTRSTRDVEEGDDDGADDDEDNDDVEDLMILGSTPQVHSSCSLAKLISCCC